LGRRIAIRTVLFNLSSVLGSFIQFALVIGAGLCGCFQFVFVFLSPFQDLLHMFGMGFSFG
jgi:hypothetical protein